MQSENFDQRIKDLLSQPPPGNDNPDWDRMEKLLDKHMPQKKDDRRRYLVFLLVFLIAGGGAFVFWQNVSGNKKEIASVNSQSQIKKAADENKQDADNNKTAIVNGEQNNEPAVPDEHTSHAADKLSPINKDGQKNSIDQNSSETEISVIAPSTTKNSKKKKDNSVISKSIVTKEKINAVPDKGPVTEKKTDMADNYKQEPTSPIAVDKNETIKESEKQKTAEENKIAVQKTETKAQQPLVSAKTKPSRPKSKASFLNKLFFTLSAGPDVSTVRLTNAGKLELSYGAGLGYQVSDRFSIRAGYYKGRKVYSAYPKDYDPPANFWGYYPNLKNIDADCKVTELPISADYAFNRTKKQSWFVSAGISSLFMKKEVYDYYFKPNYSSSYITYSRTINNQNKHYFSILNLSGGYTRTINKNFSLQAEPYLKIAMHGVGYGKVKLNSGGVLFSAIIKPFAKK